MTDSAGQTEAVVKLLHGFPKRGLWMLFESAVRGNLHLVRALLRAGVPPHCCPTPLGVSGSTISETDDPLVPIHAAAYKGHVECVKALVEEGEVDPDILDGWDWHTVDAGSYGSAYGRHSVPALYWLGRLLTPSCLYW